MPINEVIPKLMTNFKDDIPPKNKEIKFKDIYTKILIINNAI